MSREDTKEGKATFFAATGIDTTGEVVLAANAYRRQGVWIICDDAAQDALISDSATGTFARLINTDSLPVPHAFIPGDGAIYVKSGASTTQVSGWWY